MTDDERKRVLVLLAGGASCRETAKIVGRSASAVSATAKAAGIDLRQLTRTRSRKRLDEAIAKAEILLQGLDNPKDVGKWVLTLSALLDRRRAYDEDEEGSG